MSAIFLADAHESAKNQRFAAFLDLFERDFKGTKQLFLLGDIFDLLVGEVLAGQDFAQSYIYRLEQIAKSGVEVFYLEGNHDFNLRRFFTQVRVIPIEKQPFLIELAAEPAKELAGELAKEPKTVKIALAHGDIFLPKLTQKALALLRQPWLLKGLNSLDFGSFISKRILKKQAKRDLAYQMLDIKGFAQERLGHYEALGVDLALEGHFHQGYFLNKALEGSAFSDENGLRLQKLAINSLKYINLPVFACKGSFLHLDCGFFSIKEL